MVLQHSTGRTVAFGGREIFDYGGREGHAGSCPWVWGVKGWQGKQVALVFAAFPGGWSANRKTNVFGVAKSLHANTRFYECRATHTAGVRSGRHLIDSEDEGQPKPCRYE
jgi:hypothetical protein